MSLVKSFNNKYLILLGIKICQMMPRKPALAAIGVLSAAISRMKRTDLIKAVRSNQQVISGTDPLDPAELDIMTRNVLNHALICYYDFFHNIDHPERMDALFPSADELNRNFNQAAEEKGALIIVPHISNFNLLFQTITDKGFRAKLLTLQNLYSGYEVINKIRSRVGAEIVPVDEGSYFKETVEYLKSGGLAVTAVDRPVPLRKSRHQVDFFGKPSSLPIGYIKIALAADVPIIIVTTFMRADGIYEFDFSEKIHLRKYQNKMDDMIHNAETVLKKIEQLVKRAPDQWLMYYPVWPDQVRGEL